MNLVFYLVLVLVWNAATQLTVQLHLERILVVRSNKVVRRIPTESNGTPAMGLGLGTDHVRRYRGMCV